MVNVYIAPAQRAGTCVATAIVAHGAHTHVTPHDAQANLPIIAAAVGRLRGIPVECVEELAWANACRLFHHCLQQTDDAVALN